MLRLILTLMFSVGCVSQIWAGETYSEKSIVSVWNNKKDKPIVTKGSNVYRIEGDSLFIQREDGSDYFYNTIVETKDNLRFTCGNKYLVFLDKSKNQLIVSHIDEVESKIIFLQKR